MDRSSDLNGMVATITIGYYLIIVGYLDHVYLPVDGWSCIIYVTRHSKARHTSNQEFQIAHDLPAGNSVLMPTLMKSTLYELSSRQCINREEGPSADRAAISRTAA